MAGKGVAGELEDHILNASRIMVNILAEALLREKEGQITVPQFRILDMVANLTDKPAEIARMLSVSPPAISFMMERLEEKGLLRRNATEPDRRRVKLTLTPEGTALVQRVNQHRRKKMGQILRRLDAETRAQLERSLKSFYGAYLESSGPR